MNNYEVVNKGQSVIILSATTSDSSDYIGQRGTVISINSKLSYGVKFDDGEFWFYNRKEFAKASPPLSKEIKTTILTHN